jgi:transcription termination/antitermination protein NusA
MSKQLLRVAETVYTQKEIDPQLVFDTIQDALVLATKKTHGMDHDYRVVIDPKSGQYDTFRVWTVCEEDDIENPDAELTLEQAREIDKKAVLGEQVSLPVESIEFGRIAAQTAKQVILQRVREAEREKTAGLYERRVGHLISGQVKRVTRDAIFVEIGENVEAVLPRSELIAREVFRVNDRVRAYFKSIDRDQRGLQFMLSRTCNEMLVELLKLEVPEVSEEVIQVKAVARDPGLRAKVAVHTNDGRVDPVGACVGMRGARIHSISNELGGERIDIILWDDNPVQFAINAMSVEVLSINIDENTQTMDIAVRNDKLSQAIGRNGQNVRLASELTGWKLNVMGEEEAEVKQGKEVEALTRYFMSRLDVDENVATVLVEAGFSSLDEVAYVPLQEMANIPEFDENIVKTLRDRAQNALLAEALSGTKDGAPKPPADDLLNMEGMDRDLAYLLASHGIITMEDLAEQAVDEVVEIAGIEEQKAGELIMTARAPWFEQETK